MSSGNPTERTLRAGEFFGDNLDALLLLLELIAREANRRNPAETYILACGEMFSTGLQLITHGIEHGAYEGEDMVEEVREALYELAVDEVISEDVVLLLLNGFIEADIDPGGPLTDLIGDMATRTPDGVLPLDPADVADMLAALVKQSGGNAFEVSRILSETGIAMPPPARQAMMSGFVASADPVLREVGALFLLDPEADVRHATSRALLEAHSTISPQALRWMRTVRDRLRDDERAGLDAALDRAGPEPLDPAPQTKSTVEELLVSAIDGAGAQAVFAVVKEKRKRALASVMVKEEVGIADAWCNRDLSKPEVKSLVERICWETGAVAMGADFVRTLVQHHLAVSCKARAVPTAGFLEFIECIGMRDCLPEEVSAEELISRLGREADLSDKAVAGVLEGGNVWFENEGLTDSWFEEGEKVLGALYAARHRDGPGKIAAIVDAVLEPRRAEWARRFVWTALWLRQTADLLTPWVQFLVVGRELQMGRPMTEIPAMLLIAEATVEIWEESGADAVVLPNRE